MSKIRYVKKKYLILFVYVSAYVTVKFFLFLDAAV